MAPLEHERRPFSNPETDHLSGDSTPLRDALARLESAVGSIHDSDSFRRYLDAQARFHQYSWGNVLLILTQRPDATRVAGYRTWQALGRQVRRGEKGIRILVPLGVRAARHGLEQAEEDDHEHPSATVPTPTSAPAPRLRRLFGTGSVFDVSQTDGQPLP